MLDRKGSHPDSKYGPLIYWAHGLLIAVISGAVEAITANLIR